MPSKSNRTNPESILDRKKAWVFGFLRESGGSGGRATGDTRTAERDFQELVEAGCPERALVAYLWNVRTFSVFEADTRKLAARDIHQAAGHLRKAADDIEKMQGSTVLESAAAMLPSLGSTTTCPNCQSEHSAVLSWEPSHVSDMLSQLATNLDECVASIPHSNPENAAIADLLVFVEKHTSGPHHRQVAALVAAMSGRDFFETTLPVWKNDHKKLLVTARTRQLEFSS